MRPLPIDYDSVRAGLCQGLMLGTGAEQGQVLMLEAEDTSSPRPALPYFGFKITTPGVRHGNDALSFVGFDADGGRIEILSGSRRMAVSFQAYGTSHEQAYGMMALWQAALQRTDVQEALRLATISVWDIGDVRDLSALVWTKFEGRAQMDVTFGVLSQLQVVTPCVAVANASGQIQGDTDVLSVDVTAELGA